MEDMEEEEEEEMEEEMEEEEDMDDIYLENAVEFEDGTRLLYYFERIVRFLRGYIFMTTFVEQNPPEYFSGFSNMHIVHQIKNDRKVKRYRFYHLTFHFRASRFATLS
ncbi:uncharacterized protein LOC119558107 [Drosophila subpulchrella]|uniref:uncharacterized protein LOC119558107 n=1 Tax=Drosophila subpulchrella TaxID=1486046 RepID=UPI0018A169A7|nr:uncharacterized protein LOC119558107 [Drosophila subpulchrella]